MKTSKLLSSFKAVLLIILSLCSVSCSSGSVPADSTSDADELTFEQISAEKAKEIMDTAKEYVIIDARTDSEYAEGHIEGAIVIPEYDIEARAEELIPDKDTLILVYCRSGRRSKIAAEALIYLGYTNVKEFGGIIDWPYEIVKD